MQNRSDNGSANKCGYEPTYRCIENKSPVGPIGVVEYSAWILQPLPDHNDECDSSGNESTRDDSEKPKVGSNIQSKGLHFVFE